MILTLATPTHHQEVPTRAAVRRSILPRIGLISVLIIAAVVRLVLVGAQSAWVDEGYSMALAHHDVGTIVSFTALYDAHPPLYYLILHFWLTIFGSGVIQGRLLSVVCGVAAVAALYMLAKNLCGWVTGLGAALLLALSPVSVWFALETRMYAMAGLFSLVALVLLLEAIRRTHWKLWLAYAGCAAAALYVDYSSAYLLTASAVAALALLRSKSLVVRWLMAQAVVVLLVLPLCLMFYHQIQETAKIDWIPRPTLAIVGQVLHDIVSQYSTPGIAVGLVGAVLASVGLVGLARDARAAAERRRLPFLAAMTLAPLVLPLILSAIHPVFLLQAVVMTVYGVVIIVAHGVTVLVRRVPWAVIALLPLLVLNVGGLNAIATTTINEDWRASAQYVHHHVSPGDVIIFDPRFLQLPFDLYWAGYGSPTVERGYPLDETLANPHPVSLSTSSDVARATVGAHVVWMITRQDRQTASLSNDAVGAWLLTHSSPVDQQTFHNVIVYRFTMRAR